MSGRAKELPVKVIPVGTIPVMQLGARLLKLLRGENVSLAIEFNSHAVNYMSARQAFEDGDFKLVRWPSDAERDKAIDTGSVWILHWYPETPVGFYVAGASSLANLLTFVLDREDWR